MHGAIFMCTGETREECFKYKVFGLPACKENFVRQIRKGMFLFLFDTDNRKMYGVFKAASNGGMNFVPDAYVRITGTSYPAQVRFNVAWKCTPLSEAVFKPAIIDNYFRFNKFQFDLSYQQVGNLLSLFRKRRIMPDAWDDIRSHSSYSSSSNSHSPHKDQFQTSNLKPKHNPDRNPDPNHSNNPDDYALPYDPDNPGIASSVDYNMQNNCNQDPAKLSCEPCVIKDKGVYASSSSQPLQFFTSNPENCGDASKGSETSNPPTEDNVCNQVPENFYASVLEILQEIPDAPQKPSFVSEHHHSSPLRNIQPQESQNPDPNHAHQNPSFVSEHHHSSPVRNIQPQESENPKPKSNANPNNAHQNPSFVSEHHHSSSLRNIQPQESQSPNPNPNPNPNTILYSDTAMRASVFSRLKEREREPGQIDEEPTLDQLLSSLNDKPKKGVNDKGKSSKWVHDKWVNVKGKSTKRDNEKWVHDEWVNDDKWVHDKWVNDGKWVNDDKWVHDKWFNDGKWVHDKKQLSTEIDARVDTVLDEMDMDMNELSLDNYEDEEIEPPYVNFKRRNNERKINMIITEPEEEGSKKKRRFIRPSFQTEGPIRKFDVPSFQYEGPIRKSDMLFDEPMKDIETQERNVEREVLKEAEIEFEGKTFEIGSAKQNEELQGPICKNGPSESRISKDEPESGIPEDKSEPESGISKDKYKPESCIPKYKSEPEFGIPEDKSEPESGISKDKYKPESRIPKYKSEPESGIPEDEPEPKSGIPKDKSEPESENPKPCLASKLRSLIRRKLNEASTGNNQNEVLKKDFIPL